MRSAADLGQLGAGRLADTVQLPVGNVQRARVGTDRPSQMTVSPRVVVRVDQDVRAESLAPLAGGEATLVLHQSKLMSQNRMHRDGEFLTCLCLDEMDEAAIILIPPQTDKIAAALAGEECQHHSPLQMDRRVEEEPVYLILTPPLEGLWLWHVAHVGSVVHLHVPPVIAELQHVIESRQGDPAYAALMEQFIPEVQNLRTSDRVGVPLHQLAELGHAVLIDTARVGAQRTPLRALHVEYAECIQFHDRLLKKPASLQVSDKFVPKSKQPLSRRAVYFKFLARGDLQDTTKSNCRCHLREFVSFT